MYGILSSNDGFSCVTLEHSFISESGNNVYGPKIPPGQYLCVRGTHQLEHGGPFSTFEITGVPGHSGLLFHVGNFNKDSDGCVLLGESVDLVDAMITNSVATFAEFMANVKDLNSFTISIS